MRSCVCLGKMEEALRGDIKGEGHGARDGSVGQSVRQSATLRQAAISQRLWDALLYNLVQIFKMPRGRILKTEVIDLVQTFMFSCG